MNWTTQLSWKHFLEKSDSNQRNISQKTAETLCFQNNSTRSNIFRIENSFCGYYWVHIVKGFL